jgi:DNA-binding MarR family transcriptional regulator
MQADAHRGGVEQQIGYLVKRVQQALRGIMERALREHKVTLAQYAALSVLQNQPGLSNAELARRSFVTAQTMNQVLAGLERSGLVERTAHPGHGRVMQIRLTEDGERLLAQCHDATAGIHERMLAGLPVGERDRLRALLIRCAEQLERSTGG